MPIIIPKDIPAVTTLQKENIFVMTAKRAVSQDIRPIEIAVLNLMPTKIETETQLMRLFSNSPLQVNVTLINTESYQSKNTSNLHLKKFYKTFSEIKNEHFDGMIITGAPVETMPFEEVTYWEELKKIMDFAKKSVTSTIFICWGAQAALYYYYKIDKHLLSEKMFGIFQHKKQEEYDLLLKGVDDFFYIPHSRHTGINEEQVAKCEKLHILAKSEKSGSSIIKSKDNKFVFILGHLEYDRYTLRGEYLRDIEKGLDIKPPENYFIKNDIDRVNACWLSSANLIFANWLNYYVYQVTPYDAKKGKK